eukprot:TRINITY_DN1822_c0_g1_i2.p2 TRINITY_DN1822_c0_g1~~TRINITY_DN1822_c0_g1_i2.p2  ORF type:complete len:214 (+),score=74.09 TRINITY_DN1822_c0_g1_i2:93-644(+)
MAAYAALLAGATAASFDVTLTRPTAGLCAAPAGGSAPCAVGKSGAGELLRLLRTEAGVAGAPEVAVARSYDGHDWEGLFPDPLALACSADACVFTWDSAAYSYTLWRADVTQPAGTRHATAKLLAQGTFGATTADLDAFPAGGGGDRTAAGAWFDAQETREPVLLRAYVRTNPRYGPGMAGDA